MLMLPSRPRRAWLTSFWLVIAFLGGSVIGVILVILKSAVWFGVGIMIGALIAMPGLLWPQSISILYEKWHKLSEFYARATRVVVKGACFYLVFAACGLVGSTLRLTRPSTGQSMWQPRATHEPSTYLQQYETATKGSLHKGWKRSYVSWAVSSGNLWAVCLLPWLMLVAALDTDEQEGTPSTLYTLF